MYHGSPMSKLKYRDKYAPISNNLTSHVICYMVISRFCNFLLENAITLFYSVNWKTFYWNADDDGDDDADNIVGQHQQRRRKTA